MARLRITAAIAALAVFGAPHAGAAAAHEHRPPEVLAPGYTALEFVPPAPGSYRLLPLGRAADATVLDADGGERRLHRLFDGKIVVLSFIYTRCSDVNGCPLATFVMRGLQDRLLAEPEVAGRVRLVSFSFDPEHDTPAVLREYSRHFRRPEADWAFVTCPDADTLKPVLTSYDQWVIPDLDGGGDISHVLRVYLIDPELTIRNIYNVTFLHADSVLNDIRTLLLERAGRQRSGDLAG